MLLASTDETGQFLCFENTKARDGSPVSGFDSLTVLVGLAGSTLLPLSE